ncbi:hypothetical protein VPHK567_0205 [Vibrio phage K567]
MNAHETVKHYQRIKRTIVTIIDENFKGNFTIMDAFYDDEHKHWEVSVYDNGKTVEYFITSHELDCRFEFEDMKLSVPLPDVLCMNDDVLDELKKKLWT